MRPFLTEGKRNMSTIRESLEQWEMEYLSPFATLSMHSKGRVRDEEQCDIRPVFQRDRDRILHSKSFRRLKDKTQVFLTPEGDHYRTVTNFISKIKSLSIFLKYINHS